MAVISSSGSVSLRLLLSKCRVPSILSGRLASGRFILRSRRLWPVALMPARYSPNFSRSGLSMTKRNASAVGPRALPLMTTTAGSPARSSTVTVAQIRVELKAMPARAVRSSGRRLTYTSVWMSRRRAVEAADPWDEFGGCPRQLTKIAAQQQCRRGRAAPLITQVAVAEFTARRQCGEAHVLIGGQRAGLAQQRQDVLDLYHADARLDMAALRILPVDNAPFRRRHRHTLLMTNADVVGIERPAVGAALPLETALRIGHGEQVFDRRRGRDIVGRRRRACCRKNGGGLCRRSGFIRRPQRNAHVCRAHCPGESLQAVPPVTPHFEVEPAAAKIKVGRQLSARDAELQCFALGVDRAVPCTRREHVAVEIGL